MKGIDEGGVKRRGWLDERDKVGIRRRSAQDSFS